MKLELWKPYKPLKITQGWGIYNPAYLPLGFDHHNGWDYELTSKLLAPCRMKIISQDFFPKGGGNQVTAISTEKWVVPHLDDREVYIYFIFCHNKEFIHEKGDILEVGDEIAIPDNTGFSTGNHTHMGTYRVDDVGNFLDTNNANGSFDFAPYYNGYHACDVNQVMGILYKMKKLLTDFLSTVK